MRIAAFLAHTALIRQSYLDICGMNPDDFKIIESKGFINNDGGFRAGAHKLLGLDTTVGMLPGTRHCQGHLYQLFVPGG